MRPRFSERGHAGQMKGHVAERARRRPAFMQRDRDMSVPDRDPALEFEFLLQPKRALEPFRTLFWTAHGETKVTDDANRKRKFLSHGRFTEGIAAGDARQSANPA